MYEVETSKGEKVGLANTIRAAERLAAEKAAELRKDLVVKSLDGAVLVEFGRPRK